MAAAAGARGAVQAATHEGPADEGDAEKGGGWDVDSAGPEVAAQLALLLPVCPSVQERRLQYRRTGREALVGPAGASSCLNAGGTRLVKGSVAM